MRKLSAAFLAAGAVLAAVPALAADMPFYPPVIDVPDVDYGVSGSFYLRGSAAGNALWSKEAYAWDCFACGPVQIAVPVTAWGYGYSVGAGFGYETGTGLRFDATVDLVNNSGLTATHPASAGWRAGDYKTTLRSTIALANAYYDFSFGGNYGYGAAGGAFGYVGAGIGAAFNDISVQGPGWRPDGALGPEHLAGRCRHGRRGLRFRHRGGRSGLSRRLHQQDQQQRCHSGYGLDREQLAA
jgi:hypothetical protein